MNKFLADVMEEHMRTIGICIFILSIMSGFFSYNGASIEADTYDEKSSAMILAIATGVAIFVLWFCAFKMVPYLASLRAKIAGLSVVFMFCIGIFFMSTGLNVAGLVRESALEKHVSSYVNGLEDAVDAQFRDALLIEGVVTDIRGEFARYESAIKSEKQHGAYSGTKGNGAVVNALTAIKGRFKTLEDEADTFLETANTLNAQVLTRLGKIRKIVGSGQSLKYRKRMIAKESNAMRSELARMDVRHFAASVVRTLEALPGEVDIQSIFSKNKQVAEHQRVALEKVRADIETSFKRLSGFIEAATANEGVQVQAFEDMTVVRSVEVYWFYYLPFWFAGAAIDFTPLFILLLLMVGLGSKTKEELALIRILEAKRKHDLDALIYDQIKRGAGIRPDTIEETMKLMLGHQNNETKGNNSHQNRPSKAHLSILSSISETRIQRQTSASLHTYRKYYTIKRKE